MTGTAPGDQVKVWFEGGGETSDVVHLPGRLRHRPPRPGGGGRGLHGRLAGQARRHRTAVPRRTTRTRSTANGVAFDVYDVDAHGRTAPDNLGVLSHYDAVIWYTGDDVVTREPGWGPGNASRLAMQELLEVRDFVNEGGRVLYTGQRAGQQYTTSARRPSSTTRSRTGSAAPIRPSRPAASRCTDSATRRATRSSTRSARRSRRPDGGLDPDTGDPFPITGIDDPLTGLTLGRNGADSAQNQATDSSFIATERLPGGDRPGRQLPAARQLAVRRSTSRGLSGPFDPHSGRVVHVVATRRRGVQAPHAHDHASRRAERLCRSGRATTSSSTSTT